MGRMPKGEDTTRSLYALELYKQQGYSRSLRKLGDQLVEERLRLEGEEAFKRGEFPPQITDAKRQKLSISSFKQVGLWSSAYGWQEAVRLYDHAQLEEKKRKRDAEIEKMNDNHATLGSGMAIKAAQQITDLIREKRFGATAAVLLFKEGTALERVARGAATEQIAMETIPNIFDNKNHMTIDLEKLSNQQLLALERVLQEVEHPTEEHDEV